MSKSVISKHDVINIVDHDVLLNFQTIKVPLDYLVTEGSGVDIDLGHDHKCVLLSMLSMCELLLIPLPDS